MNTKNTIITLIVGTLLFIGVFMIITDQQLHQAKIGGDLIMLTPIPYILGWIFKPETNTHERQSSFGVGD